MTDRLPPLPPVDHTDLCVALSKQPADSPLPDAITRRGWNALEAITKAMRVEDQVRTGPANDARNQLKVSLPSLLGHAELACRLFADAIREAASEQ